MCRRRRRAAPWHRVVAPALGLETRHLSTDSYLTPAGARALLVLDAAMLDTLAALAEGTVTPKTQVMCTGEYLFAGRGYRCWKKTGHGLVDLEQEIARLSVRLHGAVS